MQILAHDVLMYYQLYTTTNLTLAVLVVWIFHGVLGGGAFLRPPI